MTDEQKPNETTDEAATKTDAEQEAAAKAAEAAAEAEAKKADEDGANEELDLPRAKAKIQKANDEAKGLRDRLKETEEKLANAKSPEEVDEIVKQLTTDRETAESTLLRENVALKFKLPEALQKRLTGSTREELEADAKELSELFGSEEDEEIDLEGGLNPRNQDEDPDDPRALAKKYGKRRRR